MKGKLLDKLKSVPESRRVHVSLGAMLFVLLGHVLGLDAAVTTKVTGLAITLIVGDSIRKVE